MLYGGGVFGLFMLALWLWAVLDVISTDADRCRNLPKMVWLVIVILLAAVGAMAWILLGRPQEAGFRPGGASSPRLPRTGPRGPEDNPGWFPGSAGRRGHPSATASDEAERRRRYAELDAELDRRLEAKRLEQERLAQLEGQREGQDDDLRRREGFAGPEPP